MDFIWTDVDEISEPDNEKAIMNESDSKSKDDLNKEINKNDENNDEKSAKESENKSNDLSNESKELTKQTVNTDHATPKKEKITTESHKKEKAEPKTSIKSCLKEKSTTKESTSREKLSVKTSTIKDKPLPLSAKSARPVLTSQPAAAAKTTFASTLKKAYMIFLLILIGQPLL